MAEQAHVILGILAIELLVRHDSLHCQTSEASVVQHAVRGPPPQQCGNTHLPFILIKRCSGESRVS